MFIDLTPYRDKFICVAVSGGKDSMCLLHYLMTHCKEYNIVVTAINFDHSIRGEESERDSAFVKAYCEANNVLCHSFKWLGYKFTDEASARTWRMEIYKTILVENKADLIATAHHMNDNAETVLFNLARGTSLAGMTGICDNTLLKLIRPLIGVSREDIDGYIEENNVPYVEDSTNFSDEYTRNKIRHSVIPALEEAVPGAIKNIYRFSRLAAEDEEYFSRQVNKILVRRPNGTFLIKSCTEPVIFKRALRYIIKKYGKKDFTSAQMRTVYEMQWLGNGKRFFFLGLVAQREEEGIAIFLEEWLRVCATELRFTEVFNQIAMFERLQLVTTFEGDSSEGLAHLEVGKEWQKTLRFDYDKVPPTAVVRCRKNGDKFTKYGGGTKSLGDFLTDRKVPQIYRNNLPLLCDGDKVLLIGGVEISDDIKVTEQTKRVSVFICFNPLKK